MHIGHGAVKPGKYLLFFKPHVLTAEGYLRCGVHAEELAPGVLENAAHMTRQVFNGGVLYLSAKHRNLPRKLTLIIVGYKAAQQAGNGGLAAARATAEQHAFPFCNFKGHAAKGAVLAVGIAEADIFKPCRDLTHIKSPCHNLHDAASRLLSTKLR